MNTFKSSHKTSPNILFSSLLEIPLKELLEETPYADGTSGKNLTELLKEHPKTLRGASLQGIFKELMQEQLEKLPGELVMELA